MNEADAAVIVWADRDPDVRRVLALVERKGMPARDRREGRLRFPAAAGGGTIAANSDAHARGTPMVDVADGTVRVVFGLMLTPDQYEARPGHLEFRAGRLVEARFGRHAQRDEAGLTVGLVVFPEPPPEGAEARARAVVRVYSRGALHGETDLGAVTVIDPA